MADEDDRPYTTYKARPRFLQRRDDDGSGPRGGDGPGYEVHGRRRRLDPRGWLRRGRGSGGRRLSVGRILRFVAFAAAAWVLVSAIVFLISAQIQEAKVSSAAERQLSSGGFTLTSRQHDARARLRRPHGGHQGGGRERDRHAVALGLDPAHARRRRRQRDALDPARHGGRHPRPRPRQDQRRLRDRRPRAGDQDRRELPRRRRQPPRRGQLRELPAADRLARRRHLHRAAASSRRSTAAPATAATRCG